MTAPQTVAHYTSTAIAGPTCRGCDSSEQRCAYLHGQCCASCSHWTSYDAHGNPKVHVPDQDRQQLPQQEHGTDKGYWQHRSRREHPCPSCIAMHALYLPPVRRLTWTPVLHRATDNPARCRNCGRRTPLRKNGRRIKHRIEADNPLAPYCVGDDP